MNSRLTGQAFSLIITLFLLTVLEIISTALIPAFGPKDFILPFNALFILFLGFRVNTASLPVLILAIQLFHSFFSIEGWAHGTFTGILICVGVNYLRDFINFTSMLSTMVIAFFSLIGWFTLKSILYYIGSANLDFAIGKVIGAIPECLVLAVISPFLFLLLDRIWQYESLRGMEA